jgi:hypothetical protein
MAIRGRSEPIKPHYGYPPFVLQYPLPPAPVGKTVAVRPAKDDRQRGARQGHVWLGRHPPFVLSYPLPPAPVGKAVAVRPAKDHLHRGPRIGRSGSGFPPFVYPSQAGVLVLDDATVYGLALDEATVYGLVIEDFRVGQEDDEVEYDIAEPIRLRGTFTNNAGVAADPTTVTLKLKLPSGQIVTATYAAGEVTRSSTGIYYYDWTTTMRGRHYYQFVGTGAAIAVEETFFDVEETEF